MIAIIKCTTCNETLGTIEKPAITQDDLEMYQASMICSQGHVPELEQQEPEDV